MSDELMVPNHVKAFVRPEVKAVNRAEREVMHLITNSSIDRGGDIVEHAGADVGNFLKNPVVLVDHDYRVEKIIGSAASLEITDKGIYARTKFLNTPLAKSAFELAAEGIGGWSIGFRPVSHEPIKDAKGVFKGVRFKKWELLEYSMVAIPMNQDVVNNAITRGWVVAEDVPVFFAVEPMPSIEAVQGPKAEAATRSVDPKWVERIRREQLRINRLEAAARMRDFIRELQNGR